ncbi:hypothetical protein A2U01_0065468, partial [Trifolium medium]|nr:hypothetical protein [Trifolium medium]
FTVLPTPSSADFVLLSTGGCALWEWIESDAI